jgi:hypothetical protein
VGLRGWGGSGELGAVGVRAPLLFRLSGAAREPAAKGRCSLLIPVCCPGAGSQRPLFRSDSRQLPGSRRPQAALPFWFRSAAREPAAKGRCSVQIPVSCPGSRRPKAAMLFWFPSAAREPAANGTAAFGRCAVLVPVSCPGTGGQRPLCSSGPFSHADASAAILVPNSWPGAGGQRPLSSSSSRLLSSSTHALSSGTRSRRQAEFRGAG